MSDKCADHDFASRLEFARSGDVVELGSLLDSFRPLLCKLASEKLNTRLQARLAGSDLVQETLLSATLNFCDFRGQSRKELQGWLMRIFRSRLADGLRRHLVAERRRLSAQQRGSICACEDATISPSTQAVLNEQSSALLTAMGELSDCDRRILMLRYAEQLGFEAIASQLGLPLSNVWRRWQRSVEFLRDRLGHVSRIQ